LLLRPVGGINPDFDEPSRQVTTALVVRVGAPRFAVRPKVEQLRQYTELCLAAAAVALTGFFWARPELLEQRPGYWSMRFMLTHDTVHARWSAQRS
jgi:hypothetical protein